MATALARAWLDEHDLSSVELASAGTMLNTEGRPASGGAQRAMEKRGLDLSEHVSRPVTPEMVRQADLVIAMERRHVQALVNMEPDVYQRTYTLLELARRAAAIGARPKHQPMDEWLEEVHTGRTARDHLGTSPDDDITDPIGRRQTQYDRCADQIADALDTALTHAFTT